MNQTAYKSVFRLQLGTPAKFGVTKKEKLKTTGSNTSSNCRDAPIGAIDLNFGMRSDVVDIITRAKLGDIRFRRSGVLIPRFCHSP